MKNRASPLRIADLPRPPVRFVVARRARADSTRSLLELDRVADRRDTGFRANLIGVAVGRTRDRDRADERTLRPDHQSPADGDDLRQLANAARHLAGLRG